MGGADKKHIGKGAKGKGDGSGAMTDIAPEEIEANMVLSNRDKAQHTKQRGLDSRSVQSEQLRDHANGRIEEDDDQPPE